MHQGKALLQHLWQILKHIVLEETSNVDKYHQKLFILKGASGGDVINILSGGGKHKPL